MNDAMGRLYTATSSREEEPLPLPIIDKSKSTTHRKSKSSVQKARLQIRRAAGNSIARSKQKIFEESDPTIGNVFAPNFFTTEFSNKDLTASYHYDSYHVNVPSVLVEDKKR